MITYRKLRLVRELVSLVRTVVGVIKAIIELIDMAFNYGSLCPILVGPIVSNSNPDPGCLYRMKKPASLAC